MDLRRCFRKSAAMYLQSCKINVLSWERYGEVAIACTTSVRSCVLLRLIVIRPEQHGLESSALTDSVSTERLPARERCVNWLFCAN